MSMSSFQLTDPPSKVFQDDFTPSKGNALQACVASLLGHDSLRRVPNFVTLECGYEQGIYNTLKENNADCTALKLSCSCCDNNGDIDVVDGKFGGRLCILRGKSPRGAYGHVVVARIVDNNSNKASDDGKYQFEMIHDPHPSGTFLDESEAFGWYMVFLPKE